jgi:hypothetical protein
MVQEDLKHLRKKAKKAASKAEADRKAVAVRSAAKHVAAKGWQCDYISAFACTKREGLQCAAAATPAGAQRANGSFRHVVSPPGRRRAASLSIRFAFWVTFARVAMPETANTHQQAGSCGRPLTCGSLW